MKKLNWEVKDSKIWPGVDYMVEAIDMEVDGCCYFAVFSGPGAEERAGEYAEWKNGQGASDGDGT